MKKRITAIVFIIAIIGAIMWIIINGSKKDVFPIGNKLPKTVITTIDGNYTINSKNRELLIIFFSRKCPHCEYELTILNKNIDSLNTAVIYLITTDKDYLESQDAQKYTNLLQSKNVVFGIIDNDKYLKTFGIAVTPALYFFNKNEILTSKISGETKLSRIIEEINKSSRDSSADERNAGGKN